MNLLKNTIGKKFRTITCSLLHTFAEGAAPGQEKDFMSKVLGVIMSPLSDSEDEDEIPEDLRKFLEKYQHSDREAQIVIHSLTDFSKYSSKFLIEVFCCSKYKIDKAKMLANKSKGLTFPRKGSFKRNKLNTTKVEHFLDFIFDSGLLQDVAYGINKLNYDSGDIQVLLKAILICKYSQLIEFYQHFCKESDYQPLSESTLWKILHTIKASQHKLLAGLDDIVADAMNGFKCCIKFSGQGTSRFIGKG